MQGLPTLVGRSPSKPIQDSSMQRNVTNEDYALVIMSIRLHQSYIRACLYRRHLGPHSQEGTDAYQTYIMSLLEITVKSNMTYVTCIIFINYLFNIVSWLLDRKISNNHLISRRLPHLTTFDRSNHGLPSWPSSFHFELSTASDLSKRGYAHSMTSELFGNRSFRPALLHDLYQSSDLMASLFMRLGSAITKCFCIQSTFRDTGQEAVLAVSRRRNNFTANWPYSGNNGPIVSHACNCHHNFRARNRFYPCQSLSSKNRNTRSCFLLVI